MKLTSGEIIKKPLLSEKSTWGMNEQKRYAFLVDRRADKNEIKGAIEELYKVRVETVNTQTRKGKSRRTRTGVVEQTPTKKAVVKLHADDAIELF